MCANVKKITKARKEGRIDSQETSRSEDDRIEEDIALDMHFKPIIKSLRQIVHNVGVREIKRELRYNDAAFVTKHEEGGGGGGGTGGEREG